MKTSKKFSLVMIATFLFGLVSCDTEPTFEVYDTDGDGELNQAEFQTAFNNSEWFAQYDKNANDIIESDEFIFASFDYWDTNDDDILEEEEFDAGVDGYYYGYGYGLYGSYYDWDLNDNDMLEEDEFEAAYVETDIFEAVDDNSDNELSEGEISNLMFNAMDSDDDGVIEHTEFQEDVMVLVDD